jgi:hypothetical protein
MIKLRAVFIASFMLMSAALAVQAGDLALSGNARWVVLASRPDIDTAIGVARHHRWQFPNIRVVRAANGWFAVVTGPENAADPRALRQRLTKSGGLPGDFIFSRGDSYIEQVWAPPRSPSGPSVKYDGKRDSILHLGALSVVLSSVKGKDGDRYPIANGREDGQVAFTISLDQSTRGSDDDSDTDFAELAAVPLDPVSPRPSLVFLSFWGGAHCCTVTKIATQDPRTGRWLIADGETLDSGGYAFEDLDGDGNFELLSSDNSFLYAFGGYASSNPPTQIHWLRGGRLEDVTRHANFAAYLRQRLASMEYAASLDPEQWHDNNFLGGWVAQSILVGRGEASWARMLQLYDRNAEWTYEECAVALPMAKCPDTSKRKTDFPTALRRHLNETGYPTPWLAPSAMAPPITPQAGPARYETAAAAFRNLSVDERIRLQVLLTATGHQVAVPNVDFSKRLFETILRYQSQSGLPVTGVIDDGQAAGLMREATPLLRTWGFRERAHPDRGHPIWVPLGLGLREERTRSGLVWNDFAKRVTLSYISTLSPLEDGYRAALERLAGNGSRVNYKVLRPDFFAISASGGDGLDWYMRFHRDGAGTLGFFLAWKTAETDLHMERVAVLVSASLAASMTGASFTAPITVAPPSTAVAVATPSPPVIPTPPAIAPRPPDPKPHAASSGTGFFVSRAGHLLTNAHVVQECATIEVNGPNGLVTARLLAQDRTNDLALLKAEITPVKVAAMRTGVRLGEAVAAFGYPLSGMLSTSGNFTLGNVTALTGLADDSRYFQISVPVQPGNSGGPLVDASGNLIGVVSAKLNALKVMVATNGDIPQNVNFAIKGSLAGSFLESNGVAYATGTDTAALPPADLAEHAKALSVFVACK